MTSIWNTPPSIPAPEKSVILSFNQTGFPNTKPGIRAACFSFLLGLFISLSTEAVASSDEGTVSNSYEACTSSLKAEPGKFGFEVCETECYESLKVLADEFSLNLPTRSELESFSKVEPVFQAVDFYSRPKSSESFDKRNYANKINSLKKSALMKQSKFLEDNRDWIERIENRFEVNASFLVAIFYMETRLGAVELPHKALSVFLTQMGYFDQFFQCRFTHFRTDQSKQAKRKERLLKMSRINFLYLLDYATQRGTSVDEIRSSWAGAVGLMQFMPMNFYLIEDGNEDGKVDLEEASDAIASAASFLKRKGFPSLKGVPDWQTFESDIRKAVRRYNPNSEYVDAIWEMAQKLEKTRTNSHTSDEK